jgi:hypothetical protein
LTFNSVLADGFNKTAVFNWFTTITAIDDWDVAKAKDS